MRKHAQQFQSTPTTSTQTCRNRRRDQYDDEAYVSNVFNPGLTVVHTLPVIRSHTNDLENAAASHDTIQYFVELAKFTSCCDQIVTILSGSFA